MAIDDFRLALVHPAAQPPSKLQIAQLWRENGEKKSYIKQIEAGTREKKFNISLPSTAKIENEELIIECLR